MTPDPLEEAAVSDSLSAPYKLDKISLNPFANLNSLNLTFTSAVVSEAVLDNVMRYGEREKESGKRKRRKEREREGGRARAKEKRETEDKERERESDKEKEGERRGSKRRREKRRKRVRKKLNGFSSYLDTSRLSLAIRKFSLIRSNRTR